MISRLKLLFILMLTVMTSVMTAQADLLKDLTSIAGVRSNQLVGYGLVVGLAGTGDGNLGLTHGLNGIRNTAKNIIQDQLEDGGRKDYKIDCIAAEFKDWEVSW